MSHWLTNRGKLLLVQGAWDDAGATAIRFGLLQGASTPAAIDTEAEIQDLNTIGELLALTGVDEPTNAWYTGQGTAGRLNLARSNAAEDDTNNRANLNVSANLTWTSATLGDTIYGGFWYDATTDTNDTTRLLGGLLLWTPVPTNGSNLTVDLLTNGVVRAQ